MGILTALTSRLFPSRPDGGLQLRAVNHKRENSADVFEIATTRPGIPARIEVRSKWFGLREQVQATDCTGALIASFSQWRIGRTYVTCRNDDGVETALNRSNLALTVRTPTERRVQGDHIEESVQLVQKVNPDGSMVIRSEHLKAWDQKVYVAVGTADVHFFNEQERYTEAHIPLRGTPSAELVQVMPGSGKTSLKARLDSGGTLVVQADGQPPRTVPLFISPSQLQPAEA